MGNGEKIIITKPQKVLNFCVFAKTFKVQKVRTWQTPYWKNTVKNTLYSDFLGVI
jgi:hypothetical protein